MSNMEKPMNPRAQQEAEFEKTFAKIKKAHPLVEDMLLAQDIAEVAHENAKTLYRVSDEGDIEPPDPTLP